MQINVGSPYLQESCFYAGQFTKCKVCNVELIRNGNVRQGTALNSCLLQKKSQRYFIYTLSDNSCMHLSSFIARDKILLVKLTPIKDKKRNPSYCCHCVFIKVGYFSVCCKCKNTLLWHCRYSPSFVAIFLLNYNAVALNHMITLSPSRLLKSKSCEHKMRTC